MSDNDTALPKPTSLRNQRSDDFSESYANNALFEFSGWDLKIIFGQLDQAMGVVQQHTAITIPWAVAKLTLYHLKSQIAVYELAYGKIPIPPEVFPPEPIPPSGQFKGDPRALPIYETLKKLHKDFINEVK